MDTFTTLWNRVQLRVPAAGPDLCQDLIRDAFNQLIERRPWSWLMKQGTFYPQTFTNPGTVSVTSNSAVVTGNGTSFSAAMVGAQMRVGAFLYPTYTIVQVPSTSSVVLDRVWVGANLTDLAYTVFQCYFSVPQDFDFFYSVINPSSNYRLNFNASQADLDAYDPQRTESGLGYALAYLDTTPNYQGSVGPVVQVHGSGSIPVSSNAGYSYPNDSIYNVEITTGGTSGNARFRWAQDAGTTSGTNVLTDTSPITLSNGVQVFFPMGTYLLGDVFVIACRSDRTSGVARYEMWPRPVAAPNIYSYQYVARLAPLSDDLPQLPPPIARRGDVLLEMAMCNLALYPGSAETPNPYRDPSVSIMHRKVSETLIYELEKKDDDIAMKDLIYTMPYMGPWRDGSWLQTHAVYY